MTDIATGERQTDAAMKVLVFTIGTQEFCIDILRVREIRGWTAATPLPHAPHFMRGLVNLRGTVLPVIEFAALAGYPSCEPTQRSAIIVSEYVHCQLGVLVDGVSEVLDIDPKQIKATPSIAEQSDTALVSGVLTLDQRMISVVSFEHFIPHGRQVAA